MHLQPTAASPYPVGARIARPFVPDVITTTLREGARRVIGATAKPLYPIDGKAADLDRRNPKTSLFEGGGPPQRWKEFVPRRGAHCAPVSYIAAPVTVITTMFRESARRVIGATAKPLYPIDGKAAGLDRRNPKTSLFEGGGPPAGGGRSSSPGLYMRLRESARMVLGATAKPLYPIDVKAAGIDRRNPLNPRQGLKQVHFISLAWNYSFCAEPMI